MAPNFTPPPPPPQGYISVIHLNWASTHLKVYIVIALSKGFMLYNSDVDV
jgi:hypothetical protein